MDVELRQVEPTRAALTGWVAVTHPELAATIREQLDRVWTEVARGSVRQPGHNVVLYRHGQGMEIASGVLVGEAFADTPTVRCAEVPGGEVLRALHVGPYDRMGETYDRLIAHARALGRPLGPFSWEVYGDWSDDPASLQTEIFHQLG